MCIDILTDRQKTLQIFLLFVSADIKNDNVDKRVLLDRWQKPGDITTMKDIRDRNVTTGASSRFVQKNNTLQWSSLTMSYNFRPEQLKNSICPASSFVHDERPVLLVYHPSGTGTGLSLFAFIQSDY